jgi:hypothetical protein
LHRAKKESEKKNEFALELKKLEFPPASENFIIIAPSQFQLLPHMRLAAAVKNEGAQILRRPYSYNDGANVTAERWPPWRDEMEFDAGLFFICYQREP